MNTVLVWVLVSVGGYDGNQVTYSPPMPDLVACEFLQKSASDIFTSRTSLPGKVRSRCVQIRIVVTK